MRFSVFAAAFVLVGSTPAWAQHHQNVEASGEASVGHVTLANQGNAASQAPFSRGLALLHNFEYSTAADAFREAQAADPGFVLAYWGEAMTYNHPLWAEQDAEKARAALARLGSTPADRTAKARSARERQWLAAVEALYGDGSKVERDRAYAEQMRLLFESDPSDVNARAFRALSILGLAHQGRDIALYMQGAALLEEVFPNQQDHPGVLHYLIHAYDDPAHAPLGERAARRYALVAPGAGHAQHMVSHIYLALGRWSEVEKANVQADAVVDAQRTAEGKPASSCGHYNEWLAYALMQQGKNSGEIIAGCRKQAEQEASAPAGKSAIGGWRSASNSWSDMAVRRGIETGIWPQALDWSPDSYMLARFNLAYGRLLASRQDAAAARVAQADMVAASQLIIAALPEEMPDEESLPRWLQRAIAQGEAVVALAAGERDRGLQLLKAAADAESSLPVEFGPPALQKPSTELLADELLAAGRRDEAADAYRRALAAMPGRRLSLEGLAKASR